MAVFARYDELKREIDALVAENDELKQLLLLLRENQELKSILRNQYNENTLLPAHDGQAADALALTSAPLDYAPGSSAAGSSGAPRGYCYECPIPWHPHLQLAPPSGGTGGAVAASSSPAPPAHWPLPGAQQWPERGPGFATLIPQADPGSPVGWGPLSLFPAEPQPNAERALVPFFSPRGLQHGPTAPYCVPTQALLRPPALQNAAPFAQQPPVLGGRARGQLPPAAWPLPPGPPTQPPPSQPGPAARLPPAPPAAPAPAPAPAPPEPQKPPEGKLEGSSGPSQQEPPAQRKASSESSRSSASSSTRGAKQPEGMERIVGEIAFQLDRRILSSVFPDRVRLYGFTVRNIPEKVMQRGRDPYFLLSDEQAVAILERYESVMRRLRPLGYDPALHPRLTELVVNTFGILRERPELTGPEAASYNDLQFLQRAVHSVAPPELLPSCLLLLGCLHQLSLEDGKPLFIW